MDATGNLTKDSSFPNIFVLMFSLAIFLIFYQSVPKNLAEEFDAFDFFKIKLKQAQPKFTVNKYNPGLLYELICGLYSLCTTNCILNPFDLAFTANHK